MRFHASCKTYPELSGVPEQYRIGLTLRCHRYFAASRWNRHFDSVFYWCTVAAVLAGVIVGLIRAEFRFMLVAVASALCLEMAAFAVVSQAVIRRRLIAYLQTEDYREFLRESG